jgi:hypothetical protein
MIYFLYYDTLNSFVLFLQSIPDVIWSGLIASVLTLSGVLISNRSNTNRLEIQLDHDSAEKTKERTADLRNEVYLIAVEELTKANSHLASLAQADMTKVNLADGLSGFFASAAKLQLVAEPKTSLLVNKLVAAYGELLMKLMMRLMPMQSFRTEISINEELYKQQFTEVSRVGSEMTKFNESAQKDDAIFNALLRSSENFQSQASFYSKKCESARNQLLNLSLEFNKELLAEMRIVGEQQIGVLVEIRRDLGLTSDIETYKEQMEEQWGRMSTQIDSILNEIEKKQLLK